MNSHKETFMTIDELGSKIPKYRPTFDFQGSYIDSFHEFLSKCPIKDEIFIQIKNFNEKDGDTIKGWLRREDALKLYEIAYFAKGNILELGSYHGLSTTILSMANKNSPYQKRIYSVDIDSECIKHAEVNLHLNGLRKGVTFICADAASAIKSLADKGEKFEFVFIDHSHCFEQVYSVCLALDKVMIKDGFCFFHDFNDPKNRQDYAIYQAVTEGLNPNKFDFYGIYGCAVLYRLMWKY